jgi:hypothetical protein
MIINYMLSIIRRAHVTVIIHSGSQFLTVIMWNFGYASPIEYTGEKFEMIIMYLGHASFHIPTCTIHLLVEDHISLVVMVV